LNEYCIASSHSFYAAHHLCTGEGGMICTNDKKLMKILVSLAHWGRACDCIGSDNMLLEGSCGHRFDRWLEDYDGIVDHKYVFTNMGYNLKPLDLQGAIGLVQIEKFDEIASKRKAAKKTLEKIVTDYIPGVHGVETLDQSDVCWFGTPFICEQKGLKHKLVAHLEKHLIQTRNYFTGNILMHPGYSFLDDYKSYPEANKVLDKVFFIGAAPHYGSEIFDYIEKVIKKF
jgi:CDP-6-deoxy-D-xylo-4-hexulose-3-dehydrase